MGEVAICENDLVQFSDVAFRVHRELADAGGRTVTGHDGDRAVALIQFDKLMDGEAAVPYFNRSSEWKTCRRLDMRWWVAVDSSA